MSENGTDIGKDRRKALAESEAGSRGGKKGIFLAVLIASLVMAGAGFYMAKPRKPATVSKESAAAAGAEVISIPLAEISAAAKFYEARVGEVSVRFFIMTGSDGVIRSALDACDTCAHTMKGYRQEGDNMVCNNCDQKFPSSKINLVRGGCNPIPLDNTLDGDHLKIRVADIQSAVRYFNFRR